MAGKMQQNTVDFWPDGIEIYISLYLFYTSMYFSVNQWGQSKNRRNLIFFPENSNLNNFFRLLMRCWHHNKTKSMFAGQKLLTKGYYIVQCVAGNLVTLNLIRRFDSRLEPIFVIAQKILLTSKWPENNHLTSYFQCEV